MPFLQDQEHHKEGLCVVHVDDTLVAATHPEEMKVRSTIKWCVILIPYSCSHRDAELG